MAYERQVQIAMERLDQSLARLYTLIKNGKQNEALDFMNNGELKDRYEELQNIINISNTGNMGARGTQNTGNL
tara:strand:- start:68 stop:286 length:219 start_codon:yes stop_codon:yes gene_type:complete